MSIGLPFIAIFLLILFIFQRKCKENCSICCKKCCKNKVKTNENLPVVHLEEGRGGEKTPPNDKIKENIPKQVNRIERKKKLVRKIKSEQRELNQSNETNETNDTQETVEQKAK